MVNRIVSDPPDAPLFADGSSRGGWWRELDGSGQILCELCPRACHLRPGDRGFCFVRENRDGEMALTTYGRSTGFCIDPIEKKPLNHFFPGTSVLSFGTAGCNLGCRFCQNWDISKSREIERLSEEASPQAIADAAAAIGCKSVAFTYNDPVIWAEYAIDVSRACRDRNIKTVAVTAGYITEQARAKFFDAFDAANVDLKAFTESFYFQWTASHLQPVLDTLAYLKNETDVWLEITNLVIPDANDSEDEMRRMCEWIVENLGDEVPIHFTAFHPDFRMRDREQTPHQTLLRGQELANNSGIKYAYVGNVDDVQHQSTYCPQCGELLIQRNWYEIGQYHLHGANCGSCGAKIAGHFGPKPGDWGRRRQPLQIQQFASTPVVQINRREPAVPLDDKQPQPFPKARAASITTDDTRGLLETALLLDAPQKQAVNIATLEIMQAAIQSRSPVLSDPTLGGVSEKAVEGIFTTLKRGAMLRGCCGSLGRSVKLRDALLQAATRTAIDDPRMPPVTSRELPYLSLHVSLLHAFEPLPGDAEQRRSLIDLGRHGLRIQRDGRAGLLLPNVPTENRWDLETYLRQICRKAGLPSTAWEAPNTTLERFETTAWHTELEMLLEDSGEIPETAFLSDAELQHLRQHAQRNVLAYLTGATPSYYLPECPDRNVQGMALFVHVESRPPLVLSQFSLRTGVPMQATLLSMTQIAAQSVGASGLPFETKFDVDVYIFTDLAMHGVLSAADLRGVNPARQAVLAIEQAKVGWAADPTSNPQTLLQLSKEAAPIRSDAAQCFSAELRGSRFPTISSGTGPRARDVRSRRPHALAGTFYPDSASDLTAMLEEFFASLPDNKVSPKAIMIPHAGLRYSGQIAADTLGCVAIPKQVLVIGPKHTREGVDWAISPHDAWDLPTGPVAANRELAEKLANAIPGWELDAAAHAREHCIEVELPLLSYLRNDAEVTGVALAPGSWPQAQAAATALAEVLRNMDNPPLLVISSDMNHFASDEENRRLDAMALEAMQTGSGERMLETCRQHAISMCGVYPAAIVLETLRILHGESKFQQSGYGTSADTTGDMSRVVGYAGMLIT